jgi:hypothetical protein
VKDRVKKINESGDDQVPNANGKSTFGESHLPDPSAPTRLKPASADAKQHGHDAVTKSAPLRLGDMSDADKQTAIVLNPDGTPKEISALQDQHLRGHDAKLTKVDDGPPPKFARIDLTKSEFANGLANGGVKGGPLGTSALGLAAGQTRCQPPQAGASFQQVHMTPEQREKAGFKPDVQIMQLRGPDGRVFLDKDTKKPILVGKTPAANPDDPHSEGHMFSVAKDADGTFKRRDAAGPNGQCFNNTAKDILGDDAGRLMATTAREDPHFTQKLADQNRRGFDASDIVGGTWFSKPTPSDNLDGHQDGNAVGHPGADQNQTGFDASDIVGAGGNGDKQKKKNVIDNLKDRRRQI